MKLSRLVVLIFLFCFATAARAAEVWSIGADDGDYREFALAGQYAGFSDAFPNDPNVKIGCLNTQIEWPYVHPGAMDVWAGGKAHKYTITFDLPDSETASPEKEGVYELAIKGWGHPAGPPKLDVDLNGKTQSLTTLPNARTDTILTNPKAGETTAYTLTFSRDDLKKTGNVLSIANNNGAWFVYDCIQFRKMSGRIDAITVVPNRGIYKIPGQAVPGRKVSLDYQGSFLNQPAELTVDYAPAGSAETKQVRIPLNPKDHFSAAEVLLPLEDASCDKPLHVRASLEIEGRTVAAEADCPAERKWEIHLIHQTHLDIGYTHTQVEVLDRQVQNLREALQYIEETKDYPDDAKFRFHPEGMWAVDEFLRRADEKEKAAFFKAAKDRDIHLDVLYAQAMTGMYNDEELFELMGSAIRFGRKYGIEIDSAMQTDVPGHTWGLVTVLAKNDIKYMTMGPNVCHRVGRVYYWGEKPFYWESPSGKERVLCYLLDTGYHQFHREQRGHRIGEDQIFGILDGKEWDVHPNEKREYQFDLVPIRYGIEGDNGRPNRVLSDVVKEWNEKFYYPRLRISRNSEFMKEFEKRYGDQLPVVRGDYTPYWEDGAASTSEATAINRRAKAELLWAELGFARYNPKEYPEKVGKFDSAWTNIIMYDEHTWGAHNSIAEPDSDFVKQQDDYKQAYANNGFWEAEGLTILSGALGRCPDLELRPRGKAVFADAEKGTIGNDLVTLTIDKKSGAISSFKMKGIANDLVNPGDDGNAGLNDSLYILGRNAAENRQRHDQGVKITAESGNGCAHLLIESEAPNCNVLKRYIYLNAGWEMVQISNVFEKKMERQPEGTFFGFPFNVPNGIWRIDTPWAMVQVEKDQLPGANRNFYCVQRFCNLSNEEYGIDWVTVDVPLVQFSPILFTGATNPDRSLWREHIDPNGTIYSWVCNNHWETNYKAGQDGWLECSYYIRPYLGKYDPAKSQRFARGIIDVDLTPELLQTGNENVIVTRLKPCREPAAKADSPYGPGLLVRLYNPTDKPQTVSLRFAAPQVKKDSYEPTLYLSNPWEDRLEKIPSELTIDPFDLTTLRAE